MGQDASKGGFEYRYVADNECFKRKVLLIQPPKALIASKHVAADGPQRVLRSVSFQTIVWEGNSLLPEQWLGVLGNQLAAVYFVAYQKYRLSDGETVNVLPSCDVLETKLNFAFEKVMHASPDAKFVVALWNNSEVGNDVCDKIEEEETTGDERQLPKASAEDGDDDANENEEEEEEEVSAPVKLDAKSKLLQRNKDTLKRLDEITRQQQMLTVSITNRKDCFLFGCLLAPTVLPPDVSRPLCCLLYQLRDMCAAAEAYIVDSISLYPLASTLDEDPSVMGHSMHETLWVLRTSLSKIMKAMDTDLHFMVIPCGSCKIFMGWACRPYAYVLLVVRDSCTAPLLVEKNMEYVSMHFYNVINNTTTRRTYSPMLE